MTDLRTVRRTLTIDAVSASVDTDPERLIRLLNKRLGTVTQPARPLRGMGYEHAAALCNPDTLSPRALVLTGHAHPKPFVFAEGTEHYDAPALYAALCDTFPGGWLPSRIDPALDFWHPTAFDTLAALAITDAQNRNIKIDQRGDWVRNTGRTLYLGSRTSAFYVRIYEYRAHHGFGPDCRMEVEIKLKPAHRLRLALQSPHEMLCSAPAAHRLLVALGLDSHRLPLDPGPRAPSSEERDLAFLSSTALPALRRLMAARLGDLEATLRAVLDYADETDRAKRLMRGDSTGDHPGTTSPQEPPAWTSITTPARASTSART